MGLKSKIDTIMVAPYCPAERGESIALGAAAKQRAILHGFSACGRKTLLVNSGHQTAELKGARLMRLARSVVELRMIQVSWRPLGKLLQSMLAPVAAFKLQRRLRVPLIWVYNPYLFEALYVWGARLADSGTKIVLELEDMPLARRRLGLGRVKTWLDTLSLAYLKRQINGATVVQHAMRSAFSLAPDMIWHLPVLLTDQSAEAVQVGEGSVRVGYFGGLTLDKGADFLIQVIRKSPSHCHWTVCGSGDYAVNLRRLQDDMPDRLRFLGAVAESIFVREYAGIQVLVNLHAPLADFGAGIFPFKLLEGVAAGKLVLSTGAAGCPSEVSGCIHWLKGNGVGDAVEALGNVFVLLHESARVRAEARDWVLDNFTAKIVIGRILEVIKVIPRSLCY